ncbi:MAG TPA: aminotransferase class I/II-fold pyridoxal phosphate-dependent enzyme, partial [Gemmatimonadaceae bacterium]|nr:aminotransferase class I/II-fold pyridoxal phosphate-dependent enzyme [Gemmatimonadaceae bacterium]
MTDIPSVLELDHDTMQRLGRRVADVVAEHLAGIRSKPAVTSITRERAERLLAAPAPAAGSDFETILATLQERVFANAALEPHPGFIAYVPSCPAFPAVLGDWLTSGWNFFGGAWSVGAGPSEVELVVLEWMRTWIGMPAGAGGLLTNGGSGATMTAMVAARHAAVGDDASRLARCTVYMADQSHSSAVRAAWMAGIPRANVRLVACDADFRLDVAALARAVAADRAAGMIPLMVVANAGTTNTGAVDPLEAIADLCALERIWMHVDAAYGGFAVLVPEGKAKLAGLGRADSVTMDPHKWLYVPFECGCLLVKEPAKLKAAFLINPDYLKDVETSGGEVNFADYGEQLSRRARGIQVWVNVQYFGVERLAEAIRYSLALAPFAEARVRATPGLEVLAPATLGILCFRAHPAGMDDPAALDALNERILHAVNATGKVFISSTRIRGAFSLRICPIGHRTRQADIEGLVGMVGDMASGGT